GGGGGGGGRGGSLGRGGGMVRVGVGTGLALVGSEAVPVIGDALSAACELRDAAPPGVALLGDATLALAGGAIAVRPSPAAGQRSLTAWRLISAEGARGRPRRTDTPFVGRERELDLLRGAVAD